MERICGFIVVRKPEFATTAMLKPNLHAGGKTYHGIDRLRWEDFELAYYEARLPASLLPIWQKLDQDGNDLLGLPLLKDYQEASQVLRFSAPKSEMIAVWSPELERTKGSLTCEVALNYLGMDCVGLGEWSVLLSGPYERLEHFSETVAKLNVHGLLTADAECVAVFERYLSLAASELVEPLMEGARATNVKVFGVAASAEDPEPAGRLTGRA
jgi:hypothetical protein